MVVACITSDSSCEIGTEANEANEGDVFLDGTAQIHRCVGRVWRNTLEFLKIYLKQEAKAWFSFVPFVCFC